MTSQKSWLNVGYSLRSTNPELAIKAFKRAGAVEELYRMRDKYQAIAEDGTNNGTKGLERALDLLESAQQAIDELKA